MSKITKEMYAKREDQIEKYKLGQPLKLKTPEYLAEQVEKYRLKCEELKEPFTISGLAVELGVDRQFILNYSVRDGYYPSIKRARNLAEFTLERHLLSPRNPIGAIFILKNSFGWRDEQTITHRNESIGKVLLNLENQDVIDGQVIDPPTLTDGS